MFALTHCCLFSVCQVIQWWLIASVVWVSLRRCDYLQRVHSKDGVLSPPDQGGGHCWSLPGPGDQPLWTCSHWWDFAVHRWRYGMVWLLVQHEQATSQISTSQVWRFGSHVCGAWCLSNAKSFDEPFDATSAGTHHDDTASSCFDQPEVWLSCFLELVLDYYLALLLLVLLLVFGLSMVLVLLHHELNLTMWQCESMMLVGPRSVWCRLVSPILWPRLRLCHRLLGRSCLLKDTSFRLLLQRLLQLQCHHSQKQVCCVWFASRWWGIMRLVRHFGVRTHFTSSAWGSGGCARIRAQMIAPTAVAQWTWRLLSWWALINSWIVFYLYIYMGFTLDVWFIFKLHMFLSIQRHWHTKDIIDIQKTSHDSCVCPFAK